MKKASPPPDSNDPWKAKLQESLKQDRPSPRRTGLWFAAGLLGGLALLTWWLYPGTPSELPPLVTFDVLVPAGNEAPVRALFEMGDQPYYLRGRRFIFQESRIVGDDGLSTAEVTLDNDGIAEATLKVPPKQRQLAFEARCPPDGRLPGIKDQAFIYNLPPDAKLILVTIEGTLSLATLGDWEKAAPRDIVAVPEAFTALQAARKEGCEIVYLALESDRPTVYHKLRGWTHARFGPTPNSLPDGPVLGRPEYPGEGDAAYKSILEGILSRFPGNPVAVTGSAALSRHFQAAGFRTILIGDGDRLPGVERARGWDELPGLLSKK